MEINGLRYRLPIQRVVGKGLNDAAGVDFGKDGEKGHDVLFAAPQVIPHGKEDHRQVPGPGALDQNGVVFPVAVFFPGVDVFVRQVDAAGEGGVAVHHQNLPVIPVVEVGIEHRQEGIEHTAADAHLLQSEIIPVRQGHHTAQIVIDQAHIHPLSRLLPQNLQNLAPHFSVFHNEILQEDIVLGFSQLGLHVFKGQLTQSEIFGVSVFTRGTVGVFLHIAHQSGGGGSPGLDPLDQGVVVPQAVGHLPLYRLHLLPAPSAHVVAAQQQIKQPAEHREQQNGHDPGDFVRRIALAVDNDEHHDQTDDQG